MIVLLISDNFIKSKVIIISMSEKLIEKIGSFELHKFKSLKEFYKERNIIENDAIIEIKGENSILIDESFHSKIPHVTGKMIEINQFGYFPVNSFEIPDMYANTFGITTLYQNNENTEFNLDVGFMIPTLKAPIYDEQILAKSITLGKLKGESDFIMINYN